jgi:hypothetical protein
MTALTCRLMVLRFRAFDHGRRHVVVLLRRGALRISSITCR